MRSFIIFLVAVLITIPVDSLTQKSSKRPNFIVIFTDDQGWGDLGSYGHPDIRTPSIDRLADEGVRFTSFYSAVYCGPSRAALMTGSYPPRNSLAFNHGPTSTTGIHSNEITIAEILQSEGYATMMIGKWHLGSEPSFLPHRNGFDQWFGIPYSNDMWRYHPFMPPRPNEDIRMKTARARANYTGYAHGTKPYLSEKQVEESGFLRPLPLMSNDKILEVDPDQTTLTKRFTEKALQFIENNHDRNFFLYIPHAMPHVPLFTSKKISDRSIRGLYGDVIEEIDWSVGEILKKLKDLDIDEDTVILYTSDNGPWLEYGVDGGSAGPFRGGKGTMFEGGMRVPGIFRWPGKIPPGQVSSEPVSNMDVLPTFAELAGTKTPSDRTIDGYNIWPLLAGQVDAKSPYEYFYYFSARDSVNSKPNIQAVRKGQWKLYVSWSDESKNSLKAVSLYDLHEDVSERFDRASRNPELVKEMLKTAENFTEDLHKNRRPLGGKSK